MKIRIGKTLIKITGLLFVAIYMTACVKKKGEINGTLCFPSEYIPKMTVYLQETNLDTTFKLTTIENQRLFKFTNIPYGKYYAFAYTIDKVYIDTNDFKFKANGGYTQVVPCGLTVNCKDHSLIIIKLNNKEFKDTISICDWYGAKVPPEK